MKKIYVIDLSEDGISGVYSNIKNAWEALQRTGYLNHNDKQATIWMGMNDDNQSIDAKASYSNLVKVFKDTSIAQFDCNSISAKIELFSLND